MSFSSLAALQPVRRFLLALSLAALAMLGGCAAFYVDGAVKEVPAAEFAKPAVPKPVQLVFEFQSKGVSNARATQHIKPMVEQSLRSSGLFAAVQDSPAAGGMVTVTLNNVPLSDDAFSKGFLAGLTLGAAGQQVTDGYLCTVTYQGSGQAAPIVKSAKHAIHTTVGASGAPANAYKASGIDDAIAVMVRQVMSLALNDLSRDAGFR
jgi:hypothetical protein